ncbi:hypothetical protein [Acinetobacter ursingii]|uniref:hypothetical protein n=1 Tax=Acinetobacter ursingii TaxID=108980 RepID=UPI00124C4207|nr:hypothetical protein [Acinetobacter ursingii]
MKKQVIKNKAKQFYQRAATVGGVMIATTPMAFAADGDFDLTTGLTAAAVVTGIVAAATLKAMPTFTAWGVRKALSMLR